MANTTDFTFQLWAVVGRTLWVALRHLPLFLILIVLVFAVGQGAAWWFTGQNPLTGAVTNPDGMTPIHIWLGALPGALVGCLAAGAITHRAYADFQRERFSLFRDLVAVGRGLVALLCIRAVWLGLGFLSLLPSLGIKRLVALSIAGRAGTVNIMDFGFLLAPIAMFALVVVIVILGLMWAVAVPVVIAERCGPFRALQRSAALTRGYRSQIVGFWFLYAVACGVPLIFIAVRWGFGILRQVHPALSTPFGAATALFGILSAIIIPVGLTAIYAELKRIEEPLLTTTTNGSDLRSTTPPARSR